MTKKHTLRPLRESLGILSLCEALASGLPNELDMISLAIPIRIMRDAKWIGKAPPEGAKCLVGC